jgi:hypothetical protein
MKALFVIGLILLAGIVAFFLFLRFSNQETQKDSERTRLQVQQLIAFANSHQSVRKFLNEMAQTKWTELQITPPPPKSESQSFPEETIKWQQENVRIFSLKNIEEVLAALEKTPKGTLTFTCPNDNPLQYNRSFFRLEYENDKILTLSPETL